MTDDAYLTLPIDVESATGLARQGLRMSLLDTDDAAAFASWLGAVGRGFQDGRATPEVVEARRVTAGQRRNSGVWDETLLDPATPVATVAGWPSQLSVPGHLSLGAWAVSAVTVSPTHRRRGVAGALIEAELRTAQALGLPVVALTVSEATIYSRWGFAPAAMAADWTIDTSRVTWTGPMVPGRVQFVEADRLVTEGAELVERVRLATPGQMSFDGVLWERLIGRGVGLEEQAKSLRFIRYADEHGVPQGFAVYKVLEETRTTVARAVVELHYLVSATDDAYAALWRFLIELDLVGEIRAPLRSIDEPVYWQVDDARAVVKHDEREHLWIRILDVPAMLTGRRYHTPGHFVLDVSDPLMYAAGRFLLTVQADGTAVVSELEGDIPGDTAAVALTVNELGSIYLGGVSASTLFRAGRIQELTPGAAAVLDRTFHAATTPWLSIWF
ncbi:GNAT family N-acetyltransferase [Lacisediminihabitans changchengi]|uniref:GNAT family N-acetyltransferase n=1 Tax=Lacisediminihabitans changchengi TaxID=2787634 RepID=A0A934SMZ0_9MICO|nr:GNAT family N-acetyltransferase [Lacisediminihabitans changchengi]MBK4346910.1 GNAT family N-acetyltransferase [Lacisediminihabitans changchengi]MBK4347967.1 GNAT family N-acetyltransferase [Lacisediminihabitans changchengi]